MKKIEDYIEQLSTANSSELLFDRFALIMKDFGYDRVAYGFATDHPSLGIKKMHGHMNSFPSDFMSYYAQEGLIEVDPIPAYMMKSAIPSFWSRAIKNLSPRAEKLIKNAAEAGLKDGALIPLHSVGGEVAGLSMSSDKVLQNQSYENLAVLQFLGIYFHENYKSFLGEEAPVELSDREYEILSWAAEGKTDPEIVEITGIKLPTVRYHWNNIFKKLNAYGRCYATCKAVHLKLVVPYSLIKNYQF